MPPGAPKYPNRAYAKTAKVAISEQAVARMAKRLFGNGLIYVKETDLAKTSQPERHHHPEVEMFLCENQVATEWFFPQCLEWQLLWNTFSELKLSLSQKFIVSIFHKEAPFCRLSKQENSGLIKYLVHFPKSATT